MVKFEELHCRISAKNRELLRQYVSFLKIQGKRITESKIVDDALNMYGLEDRCREQHAKIEGLYKKK